MFIWNKIPQETNWKHEYEKLRAQMEENFYKTHQRSGKQN
jgi:hypothetical protein